jgi:hypothetical protein
MFHIFRWRRENRNGGTTSSDPTADQENKNSHSRRHRLRVYRGRQSLERFFHVRTHQSPSDHDKQQVIRNELFTV